MIRQRGFTLMEILVAFVVMTLSLGVILNILSLAMRTTQSADQKQQALLLAESALAKLQADPALTAGRYRSESGTALVWQAEVTEWSFPDQDVATRYPLLPLQVTVSVLQENGDAPLLTLSALKLANEVQ